MIIFVVVWGVGIESYPGAPDSFLHSETFVVILRFLVRDSLGGRGWGSRGPFYFGWKNFEVMMRVRMRGRMKGKMKIIDVFLHFFVILIIHVVVVVVIHTNDHDFVFVVVVAVEIIIVDVVVELEKASIHLKK